ncbi:MAG: DM13 domain-containing protein [Pseudomonadota bacterium]
MAAFNFLRAALLASTLLIAAAFAAVSATGAAETTAQSAAATTLYSGQFEGAGGKRSGGTFEIFEADGKTFIRLSDDFHLSRVPDPKLAFGNGDYLDGTIYAKLTSFNGAQVYEIPARLDPATFTQVWIWCERFGVPLAKADIDAA